MARGHQKEASRLKAQKEAAKRGGNKNSQIKARAAGLQFKCSKCFIQLANYNIVRDHFEAKHPKDIVPAESNFTE